MYKKFIILAAILTLSVVTLFGSSIATKNAYTESTKSDVVVERLPDSSVSQGVVERVKLSWPWYLTRISGLVAAVTFVILMLSGIGLITGHTFSLLEPITAWASHRALGITFAVSVFLHIGALYFDHFVSFSLVSLFVPFMSDFKPVELFGISFGSLYVALGVLSLYLVIAVMITSLLWVEKKPKLWKVTHLMSYIAMIFIFVHALYLGTDLSSGLFRLMWIVSAFAVLLASLSRLWRAKTV